ncbi:Cytochrome b5-like Heme/Steroid binding domain protein [uncultured archaeon]|nr:Cytochrome b5-like Heme/Steroid binding domain protein [uncultured archaeon]
MKAMFIAIVALALLFAGCTANPQDLAAKAPAKNSLGQGTGANQQATGLNQVIINPHGAEQTGGQGQQQNAATGQITLSAAEVAKHSSKGDCWMTINGNVYDLSSFTTHPGGDAYVPYCGTEATAAFETKGGTGKTHSSNAAALLPNFLVGAIGQTVGAPQAGGSTPPALPNTGAPPAFLGNRATANASAQNATVPPAQLQQQSLAPSTASLSASEVAKHSVQGDCWMIISGNVYDLSSFTNHPGGTAYVPYCGTDGTVGFQTKGGTGSHSANAYAMLANYYIGALGQTVAASANGATGSGINTQGTTTAGGAQTPPRNVTSGSWDNENEHEGWEDD